MSEWKEIALEDKAKEITVGFVGPMATEYIENGIPFLRSQNIIPFSLNLNGLKYISESFHKRLKKSELKPGDVVVVRTGKPGSSTVIPSSLPVANCSDLVIIRTGENLDPFFVSYFINSITNSHIDAHLVGAVQQHFNVGSAKQIQIPDIDINHQRAIAAVLSSLDDKIDLLYRQNQTLERMAETLFRQWFVEEAKEEWEEGTLADLAIFFNGKQRPNETGTIPIYGGNGILGFTNTSNYKGKSIIIGRVGAYCGSLYYENKEIWVSDNALLVKSKDENQTHFLFYLLKTLDLNLMAEGSSHPLLTQTLLKSIPINIPAKEKIQQFDNQIEYIRNKTESNQTQIRTLSTLRDTFLPKLMSGEVRVEM
jgi:type I restriction enzyme, S subunit